MYVVYCQNKPRSEYIVAEYEAYFEVSIAYYTLLLLKAVGASQVDYSVTCGIYLKQTLEDCDTAHAAKVSATEEKSYFVYFKFSCC